MRPKFLMRLATVMAAFVVPSAARAATPADVYLFAGQSNSAGFGMTKETLPAELQTTFKKVQIWTPFARERQGDFTPLEPGVNSNHPNSMWACESQIGLRLENDPAQSGPVFFIKSAVGGAPLEPRAETRNWHPSEKGKLYDGFRDTLTRGLARLKEGGYEPRFRAFVWVQGETEIARGPEVAAHYGTWLKDLIAAVRQDTGTPALDVVVVRTNKNYGHGALANGILTFQQSQVAAADDHVFLVDNHYPLLSDSTHYTAAAHQAVGDDVLAVLRGQYPQVPPSISPSQKFTLPAGSANGTTVGIVKFDNLPQPEVRWATESPAFTIDPFTGRLSVSGETKLTTTGILSVPVIASNGTQDARANVTVTLTAPRPASADPFDVTSRVIAVRPEATASLVQDEGKLNEIRDADWPKTQQRFVAPFPRTRFLPADPPGLSLNDGDNTLVMRLDAAAETLWKPGESDCFAISTVIRPETSLRKVGAVWSLTNAQKRILFGLAYNFAAARFELRITDNIGRINGINAAENSSAPNTNYLVTVVKTGSRVIVRINGKEQMAVDNARFPVLTKEDGATVLFWGGGQANAGEFTGKAGGFFLANGPVTKAALATIERQLAQPANITLTPAQ